MEASAVSPWTMVWEDSSISYLLLPPPMRDLITRAASTMSTRPRMMGTRWVFFRLAGRRWLLPLLRRSSAGGRRELPLRLLLPLREEEALRFRLLLFRLPEERLLEEDRPEDRLLPLGFLRAELRSSQLGAVRSQSYSSKSL